MGRKVYLCYWDNLGFECVINMTSWEHRSLLSTIAGKDLEKPPVNLHHMVLRAKMNPQRNPEIWTFTTQEDIEEKYIQHFAQTNPQGLVDLIREKGNCVYRVSEYKHPVIK